MATDLTGFFVAPFAPDGEPLGVAFRAYSSLSANWLDASDRFLALHGDIFRASWGHELVDIETKLTNCAGIGLCTFYVKNEIASSHLFLSGVSADDDERSVSLLFVESLRRVHLVQLADRPMPFSSVLEIQERPVDIVVIWNPPVDENSTRMAHELAVHFAGAFFRREIARYQG